ncbi:MAG: PIN domain-containing protein [Acidobacteriaceae bacterium]
MSGEDFFDTTILVYAFAQDDPRSSVAEGLLNNGGAISVQVLNEFVSVARRKFRMSWGEVVEALAAVRVLCAAPIAMTVDTHDAALRIAQRYGFHIYDSLIVASAIEAGCTTLYSEDLQHGQSIGPITIRNPFGGGKARPPLSLQKPAQRK